MSASDRQRSDAKRREAASRLGLWCIYAIGDIEGPLAGEIKIGVCEHGKLNDTVRKAQVYRSAVTAVRLERYFRGRLATEGLRAALEARLRGMGRHLRGSIWRMDHVGLALLLREIADAEGVLIMTDEDADALIDIQIERDMGRALR